MTPGKVHVFVGSASSRLSSMKGFELHNVSGPHPAGLVGTQINKIDPINKGELVWTVTPQDVIINITIDYNYENKFLNYAEIVQLVKQIMIKSEFFLIEEALDKLNLKLIKEYSSIKSMFIKITKPSILPDCMVSVSNNYKSQS